MTKRCQWTSHHLPTCVSEMYMTKSETNVILSYMSISPKALIPNAILRTIQHAIITSKVLEAACYASAGSFAVLTHPLNLEKQG